MPEPTPFYDALAPHYHLIFDDWNQSIARQAAILNRLLPAPSDLRILDCACGIGTQALGLAALGHQVVASDLSPAAIDRARHEAARRHLDISFHVADMTSLDGIPGQDFDVVAALDNALPHLTPDQLLRATSAMAAKLKPAGLFLASLRDYDALLQEKPAMQPPAFFGPPDSQRIVHQVWRWTGDTHYTLHLYITLQARHEWTTHHFISHYRALQRQELNSALQAAGLSQIRWLTPAESGFYQPIVTARRTP